MTSRSHPDPVNRCRFHKQQAKQVALLILGLRGNHPRYPGGRSAAAAGIFFISGRILGENGRAANEWLRARCLHPGDEACRAGSSARATGLNRPNCRPGARVAAPEAPRRDPDSELPVDPQLRTSLTPPRPAGWRSRAVPARPQRRALSTARQAGHCGTMESSKDRTAARAGYDQLAKTTTLDFAINRGRSGTNHSSFSDRPSAQTFLHSCGTAPYYNNARIGTAAGCAQHRCTSDPRYRSQAAPLAPELLASSRRHNWVRLFD